MAYNKQNWVDLPNTSTPISAERLNYMEQGIYDASLSGGSGVYVGETEPTEENINAWINPDENLLKYKNNSEWQNVIAGGDTIPIGTIVPFTGTTAPTNWLICDGSEISRTTYEDLFTKIGTSFGEGNGTDTFNLPDLRGRIPIGAGSSDNDTHNFALGSTGGEYEHTLTLAEMPSHKHNLIWYDAGSGGGAKLPYGLASTKETGGDTSVIKSAGGDSPHNNIQPYSTVNYIIKYSNSIGLVGNVVNKKSNSTTDSYCCDYMNKLIEKSNSNKRFYLSSNRTNSSSHTMAIDESKLKLTTTGGKIFAIISAPIYGAGSGSPHMQVLVDGTPKTDMLVGHNNSVITTFSTIFDLESGEHEFAIGMVKGNDSSVTIGAYLGCSISVIEL